MRPPPVSIKTPTTIHPKEIEMMSPELPTVPVESGPTEPTRSLYLKRVPEGV